MKGIKDFFLFFIDQIHTNKIINFAAQMAYNVLLAFIPFAMIIHSFFKWLSSDWSMQISEKIQELLPPFMDALLESANILSYGPQTSFWSNLLFVLFVLYFSIAALRSLVITVTKVMQVKETRNYFKLWGVGTIYLVFLIIFMFFFFAFYMITRYLTLYFFNTMGLSDSFMTYWNLFTLVFLAAYLTVLLTFGYMYAPPQRMRLKNALPGSIFVSVGWLLVTSFYEYIIKRFIDLTSLTLLFEGPFSFIVAIYFICLVLVLGAVINMYFYRKEVGVREAEENRKN